MISESCFELGAQWYSFDNGMTWERFPINTPKDPDRAEMTVIAVNYDIGEITIKVTP